MSQLITATSPPANDPFAIGWRDVCRTLPDGSTVIEQVPLTLEDALHPQEGDTIVQNTVHNRTWVYLQNVIAARCEADPHTLVLADCKVLWEDGVHHSPDIAVIPDVAEVRDHYGQFDVAAEGTRPSFILEVVSPATRQNDVTAKLADYHKYGVPYYFIVDFEDEDSPPRILGYRRTARRYVRIPADDEGRAWVEPLGIFLGVADGRVVVYDGATEQELGDYAAITTALAEQQAQAQAERTRADTERQRADTERQRADGAEARADAERQRADGAEARADAERARAEALEAKLRQLEAGREPPAVP